MTTLTDVMDGMQQSVPQSFYFPKADSPLLAMFDPSALIAWKHLPGFRAARQTAFEYFEKHPHDREPRSYLILRMNGEVALWRFGPRGSHKRLWNFGDPFKPKSQPKKEAA